MIKNNEFKLCNNNIFNEIFLRVPNILITFINECIAPEQVLLEDEIKVELKYNMHENKFNNLSIVNAKKLKINVINGTRSPKESIEKNILFLNDDFYNDSEKTIQLNIVFSPDTRGNVLSKLFLTDVDTNKPVSESICIYNYNIAKCFDIYYSKDFSDNNKNGKLIRWGALLNTENIEDIADIIGNDLMSSEDKKRFIEVAEEVHDKYVNFTKE